MSLFQEINQMGTTVLIATHDEILIESFPSRVMELREGRLTPQGEELSVNRRDELEGELSL